jgi:hypothetical protein
MGLSRIGGEIVLSYPHLLKKTNNPPRKSQWVV